MPIPTDDDIRAIVARFALEPHPEGGYYREIYRSPMTFQHPAIPADPPATRCGGTLIYFLLAAEQFSAFHRVKWADEVWHLYAGGPLELHTIDTDGRHALQVLTTDLARGEPAGVVAAGVWQAARLAPGARWAFCGCTVSPGFDFADFEMPPAAELRDAYPEHAELIERLGRC
jgi:uncharacterized protein